MDVSETQKPKVDHTLEARQEAELLRETLIAGLAAAASDLSSVANDILHSATITRVQRTGIVLILGLMMVLLAINGWASWETHKDAQANRATGDLIEGCVIPGGDCYEANAERTAGVVTVINRVTVAAATCARTSENDTEAEIKNCIQVTLAREETAEPTEGN